MTTVLQNNFFQKFGKYEVKFFVDWKRGFAFIFYAFTRKIYHVSIAL